MSELRATRSEAHWPRRIFHMLGGVAMAFVGSQLSTKKEMIIAALSLTVIWLICDLARLRIQSLNERGLQVFRPLIRKGEEASFSGISYYLIGASIAVIVFPRDVALLSILFLGFGDPVAALVGLRFGKHRVSQVQKTVEGAFGCFVICMIITFLVSFGLPTFQSLGWLERFGLAVLGGACATCGELLPMKTDDNLSMPLISGALFWVMTSVLNLVPGLYEL